MVGAGISGLTAAWTLHKAGVEVTVLEGSSRVGGRFQSPIVGGCRMEAGANFLSSAYQVIPRIAEEVGVPLRPLALRSGFYLDGQIKTLRLDCPCQVFTSGAVPWSEAPRMGAGMLRLFGASHSRSNTRIDDWTDFDGSDGSAAVQKLFGKPATSRLIAAAFSGYYSLDLYQSGAAGPLAMMSFFTSPAKTLTAEHGMESIAQALAERLDVQLDCPVTKVGVSDGSAYTCTPTGTIAADHVTLTVPGKEAGLLLPEANDPQLPTFPLNETTLIA